MLFETEMNLPFDANNLPKDYKMDKTSKFELQEKIQN